MRKIEQQMNDAISNNQNWQSANTSVHFNEEENLSVVRLHGNKIAEIGETFIRLFDGGWQTTTTKSRLNAILSEHGDVGDKVFQKNFDWFVSMNTAEGITTVPFFNSMRLANY
jgi:D-mannonate dehydratase